MVSLTQFSLLHIADLGGRRAAQGRAWSEAVETSRLPASPAHHQAGYSAADSEASEERTALIYPAKPRTDCNTEDFTWTHKMSQIEAVPKDTVRVIFTYLLKIRKTGFGTHEHFQDLILPVVENAKTTMGFWNSTRGPLPPQQRAHPVWDMLPLPERTQALPGHMTPEEERRDYEMTY